jgi:hypothetical protein
MANKHIGYASMNESFEIKLALPFESRGGVVKSTLSTTNPNGDYLVLQNLTRAEALKLCDMLEQAIENLREVVQRAG